MSWAKPSAAEAGWRDEAERSSGYSLVTAEQLGVESLGTMVVNARSRSVDLSTRTPKWEHAATLQVVSLAVPISSILADSDSDGRANFGTIKRQIESQARPVALTCGSDEQSILDALISAEQRAEDSTNLTQFIRLAGALSTWLALPPLARRQVLSHPSIEGGIKFRASNFLPLVRLIKLIEHSAGGAETERPPIVVRASKRQPVGSLHVSGVRGALRQASGEWGSVEARGQIKVPLAELHIPDNAALQEFRNLFGRRGCTDEELLAFIIANAQPVEAMGGNNLVNLTQWAQVGESITPTLADASRASIIQHYLQMPLDKRVLEIGSTGRVTFYGMRMDIRYDPPLKIEPFLNRMAATLGVKRKPSRNR